VSEKRNSDFVASPHNVDVKVGRLVSDARFFITRSGRPKITFRLAVPRDITKPPKSGGNVDFFQVVAYGDRFATLLPRLRKGVKVAVTGWTQSRDVQVDGVHRVVVETVADSIAFVAEEPEDVQTSPPESHPWEVEE